MISYIIPLLLILPLLAEFRMEDHIIPKGTPNTYPSEQIDPRYSNSYGGPYYGAPYIQNTPYGPYYAVPTYNYSERYFDNPNWPNVSPNDVYLAPSGTSYYGPGYGNGYYGNGYYNGRSQTTTIYNTPYNTAPGSSSYYYNR